MVDMGWSKYESGIEYGNLQACIKLRASMGLSVDDIHGLTCDDEACCEECTKRNTLR